MINEITLKAEAMMKRLFVVIGILCMTALTACTDIFFEAHEEVTKGAPPHVYVGGYDYDTNVGFQRACYWKDGQRVWLGEASQNVGSYVSDLKVANGKVYAVGYDYTSNHAGPAATLWIDGVNMSILSTQAGSVANSIYIDGNDVYIAGQDNTGGNTYATYWQNYSRVNVNLNTSSYFNYIQVDNGIIKCTGYLYDPLNGWGYYYLEIDGAMQTYSYLGNQPDTLYASTKVGNQVYTAGRDPGTGQPVYRIDGESPYYPTPYSNGAGYDLEYINGTVYFLGYYNDITYGNRLYYIRDYTPNFVNILTTNTPHMAVSTNGYGVYIAGQMSPNYAFVWNEGMLLQLSNYSSGANCIFLDE